MIAKFSIVAWPFFQNITIQRIVINEFFITKITGDVNNYINLV